METVQYVLDYFFGNFWHFVCLCILLMCIGHKGNYMIQENKRDDDGKRS
jgi:hypothetical protein